LGSLPEGQELIWVALGIGMAACATVLLSAIPRAAFIYMSVILIPTAFKCLLFRVPDRGSGNPTPLGGMGPARTRCTLGHGELQTRQPYGLGLQVPHCMGYEIPVRDPRRGCGATVPRARARDGACTRDGHSCRVDQS